MGNQESQELSDVIAEVMGSNIERQLRMVDASFFAMPLVVLQMQPKPLGRQLPGYPLVVALQPVVRASTHAEYAPGVSFDFDDAGFSPVKRMLRRGCNVVVSPQHIRNTRMNVSQEIIDEAPYDSLVVAELEPDGDTVGNGRILYYNRDLLYGGRGVSLDEGSFGEGVSRCNIHFAFLPKHNGVERSLCYFRKGWNLVRD